MTWPFGDGCLYIFRRFEVSGRLSPTAKRAIPAARPARQPGRSIVDQRRTPWALIITVVVLVVFAGSVVAITVSRGGQKTAKASAGGEITPTALTGKATTEKAANRVADTSGIDGVLAWDTTGWPGDGSAHVGALQHDHVGGPVAYAVVPPVGGPHNATWMNAGIYTTPVPSERAIHNLEHGAVWITYDPGLPAAQITQLTTFVTKQSKIAEPPASAGAASTSNRYIDLSPWVSNTLPSPIVISAWGHQLRVTTPTDARLQQFIDTFRHSRKHNPEYGEPVDGIAVQTGGRPATD
jgi:Protein of unknown function (DUF3105)